MKQITVLLAALILLFACKKEEAPKPPKEKIELRFSKNALAYVDIPVGKYFIYRDSVTSELDSVVVMQNKFEIVHHPFVSGNGGWGVFSLPEYSGEKFEITFNSWKNGFTNEWLKASSELINYSWGLSSNDTGAVNLRALMSYVFNHTHSGTPTYNITIEGKTYTDVNITKDYNGLTNGHPAFYESTYYWAKGVGIIKRTIKDGLKPEQTVYLIRNN